MDKRELWLQLKNYHFDHIVPPDLWEYIQSAFGGVDASTKAFADKIARKHRWNSKFTLAAIGEYKKFIYLGVISDFYVTPSKVIDVIWHEHILFSKAYRDFCIEVIQYEFHHYPELIPMQDQTEQFNVQYLDTLELYKKEFGINPPAGIWDIPKFDSEKVGEIIDHTEEKGRTSDIVTINTSTDTTPLYTYFDNADDIGDCPEFQDGGDFGGAGADGDWSDSSSDSASDSGSSDAGGCSSGCGGCGGGD
jgi:hypothetical protein